MSTWTRSIRLVVIAVAAALVMLAIALVSSPVEEAQAQGAAADYFLKIDGIAGESVDERHAGEIEVLSWSWGASNPGSALSGGGAGKVKMNDFNLFLKTGKSTPKLMGAVARGNVIPSATMTGVSSSGHTFLEVKLENIMVSSFKTGSSQGDTPTDQISIDFTRVIIEHTGQNADGSPGEVTRVGYDLAKAKSI